MLRMDHNPLTCVRKSAVAAAAWLLCAVALPAAAQPLPANEGVSADFPLQRLPAGSWVYDDLEKLVLLRLIDPIPLDTRPLGRSDIAVSLASAHRADASFGDNPAASRLLREFAWELGQMGLPSPYEDTKALMVVGSDRRFMRNRLAALGRLEAAPEVSSSFGERSSLGLELSVFMRPNVFFYEDIFVTEVDESESVGDALIAHSDILLMTDRAYVTLRLKHLDLTFGRDNIRWGPGRSGTLLLSDAAPPFFMFSYRGRIGKSLLGEAFHGTLNTFEGRYLAGHRVRLSLGQSLTIGLAESVRYDSPALEPLYVIGIVPYALVEKLLYRDSSPEGKAGDNQRNNIMQSVDISWRPGDGTELYGEFLADDISTESGEMPSRIGYQLGAKRIRPVSAGLLLVHAEYTRVWNYTYSVYYKRDFFYRGLPLGYAGGPDSKNLALWLTLDTGSDWSFEVEAALSRKGEGAVGSSWSPGDYCPEACGATGQADASKLSGVVETKSGVTARLFWRPKDNILASLGLGAITVRSEGHAEGCDRTYPKLEAGLQARW